MCGLKSICIDIYMAVCSDSRGNNVLCKSGVGRKKKKIHTSNRAMFIPPCLRAVLKLSGFQCHTLTISNLFQLYVFIQNSYETFNQEGRIYLSFFIVGSKQVWKVISWTVTAHITWHWYRTSPDTLNWPSVRCLYDRIPRYILSVRAPKLLTMEPTACRSLHPGNSERER